MWQDRRDKSAELIEVASYTFLYKKGKAYAIQYYDTIIAEIHRQVVVLDSGGFRTKTTKQRMNEVLQGQYIVYAEKGKWFVQNRGTGERMPFEDGMKLATFE